MTVEELINELKKQDPKAMVIRSGYEGGVEEVTIVDEVIIKLNVNSEWYYGSHEIDSSNGDTKAIYLS